MNSHFKRGFVKTGGKLLPKMPSVLSNIPSAKDLAKLKDRGLTLLNPTHWEVQKYLKGFKKTALDMKSLTRMFSSPLIRAGGTKGTRAAYEKVLAGTTAHGFNEFSFAKNIMPGIRQLKQLLLEQGIPEAERHAHVLQNMEYAAGYAASPEMKAKINQKIIAYIEQYLPQLGRSFVEAIRSSL